MLNTSCFINANAYERLINANCFHFTFQTIYINEMCVNNNNKHKKHIFIYNYRNYHL